MATDLERLVVQLSADIKSYERAMARAQGVTNRQFNAIERRAQQMNSRLNAIGATAARGLIAPLSSIGAALGVAEIARYADAWTEAGNKIAATAQITGTAAVDLNTLKDAANAARTDFTSYVDLYAKILRSSSGVAKSQEEIAIATDTVAKAFKAGGAATSEQIAGILQLSQALGSGLLQGDELRSIRENAPLLAKAIADEFETTIAGLKELGSEGKLTSDRVFKAILNAQEPIQAAFAATNATIRDAITEVNNEFLAYIGNADESAGASARLVAALQTLADNFEGVADTVVTFATLLIGALTGRALAGVVAGIGNAVVALGAFLTALRAGTAATLTFRAALGPIGLIAGAAASAVYLFSDSMDDAERSAKTHAETVNELKFQIDNLDYANAEAVASTRSKIAADIDAAKTALTRAKAERELAASIAASNVGSVKPIPGLSPEQQTLNTAAGVEDDPATQDRQAYIDQLETQLRDLDDLNKQLDDYASGRAKPTRDDLNFGNGAGAAADSGSGKRDTDEFKREVEQIQARKDSILAETEAIRGLNPLLDDYGFALEQARTRHDLLTAAEREGIEITPTLTASIDALASGYAAASAEAVRLAESQDKARQRAEDMNQLGRDVLGGFISDIQRGTSATEALANALDQVASKLLDAGLDALFDGGGILSGLLGGRNSGFVPNTTYGAFIGLAGGGRVRGRGTSTSDSIPARLSNGEYVVRAAAVKKPGVLTALEAINGAGFANGGLVAPRMPILSAPAAKPTQVIDSRSYTIDARGAAPGVAEEIRAALIEYDRKIAPQTARKAVAAGRRAGIEGL